MTERPYQLQTAMASTSSSQPAGDSGIVNATPDQITAYTDLAISLSLHRWPSLTVAVQNQWGGPDSAGKRDWLAGVISDLFTSTPTTDEEDIEDVLLQVMGDEFDCQLEDGSEVEVAGEICRLRREAHRGKFAEIDELRRKWEEKGRGRDALGFGKIVVQEQDSTDDEDGEDGGVGVDEDVEMDEAPQLIHAPKPKHEPEVDEDGFTKVPTRRKKQ